MRVSYLRKLKVNVLKCIYIEKKIRTHLEGLWPSAYSLRDILNRTFFFCPESMGVQTFALNRTNWRDHKKINSICPVSEFHIKPYKEPPTAIDF